MGINISFDSADIGGNLKMFEETIVRGNPDIDISFKNAKIRQGVELMSEAEIENVVSGAEKELKEDSEEYKALEVLKGKEKSDSIGFRNAVLDHVADFASGTLANLLSAYIMSR